MKKYITIATLLAAGTAIANAVEFELAGGWDFSSAELAGGTIAATSGSKNLTMSTFGQTLSGGSLNFNSTTGTTNYASIDVSKLGIGPASGNDDASFKVVLTLTSFTMPGNPRLLWSAKDDSNDYKTGLSVNGKGEAVTMWEGSSTGRSLGNATSYLSSISAPVTIESVFTSSGATISFNGQQLFTDSGLKWTGSDLSTIYIGNWSHGQPNSAATMGVSKVEVYTAVPEPSAFGLLAGIGALALVASRRRRK